MSYLRVSTLLIFAFELANGFNLGINHPLNLNERHVSSVKENWIVQPLDHFDKKENKTLKMKYFVNLDYWKPNGPIYVYIGGFTKASPTSIDNGIGNIIEKLAIETKGAMLATEHRYYGNSVPDIPDDIITEYYKYLSSRQALKDIAYLIETFKSDPKFKSSKVVAVGGSYAGSLAAWMRALYPHLVDAAIASSAPVLAKTDFREYLDGVRNTFDKYGTKNCLANIKKAFDRYEEYLKTPDLIDMLKSELGVCARNDLTLLENQQYLFYCVYFGVSNAAYEKPQSVIDTCQLYEDSLKLSTSNGKMENQKYLRLSDQDTLCIGTEGCLNVDFKSLTLTDPWTYQQCTEFGYFPTTSSEHQPFVRWNPIDFELKFCKKLVGGDIGKKIDESVARTNKMYGGLKPNVTKVVFSNGDMDPWQALGVLKDLGPDVRAIIINGTSHDALLQAESPYTPDSEDLVAKKIYVKELIKAWVSAK